MGEEELERLRDENARLRAQVESLTASSHGNQASPVDVFQLLLDKVAFGIFVLDAEERFKSFRVGRLALAAPPEHFLGRRVHEVFPDELARLFVAATERAREEGQDSSLAYDLPHGEEGPGHYVAHFAPMPDGGTAVLVTDVTEQHRAEASVRESERRFRALIEKATDILYVLDAQLIVRFWSPGAVQALGWLPEEAVGRAGLDFVHPDDVGRLGKPDPHGPQGTPELFHYRVRHKDGSWRDLEAVVRNLLAEPAVNGVIVNARDVTAQRRLEALWSETEKLESIGRLAGGVAHDFNNLLTVILSCGELMLEAMESGQAPLADDVREILTAGERARQLTRQLLSFARRQVVAPVVLDVNGLLAESERLLRRVLGEDVSLAISPAAVPCMVRVDPTQLQQVVLNLAVNARDAMPRGGRLEIASERFEVTAAQAESRIGLHAGPHVRLTVRDDGVGMAPEVRIHVFEPFFTTKPQGKGTGLGLATAYGIVSQSGGSISVESELGKGSVFEILLPRTDEVPAPPRSVIPSPAVAAHEVVLLVEDDPGVGNVTERILRDAGYRVLHAHGGIEAIAMAEREPTLHLLLTDVVMPGADGRQVADAVLRIHGGVRVLFMSGYTDEAIVHHGVVDVGVQLLSKPFTPAVLLARLRAVLDAKA